MIFVTGGTGLLGNCIVRRLCELNVNTRVLCRAGSTRKPFDGLPVEIVEGDLSDSHALTKAIENCSAVIHSAAHIHIGWQQLERSREVNVQGTQRIVDACIANRAKLIHVSTVDTLPAATSGECPVNESGIGGVPKVPCSYVVSKREAEQVVSGAVAEGKLNAAIVHPGFMLGPFDWKPSSGRMMLELTKAPFLVAPPGGGSVCDARDVAAAIVNAVLADVPSGEHYILAGENLTYQDLWRRMLETAGQPNKVFRSLRGGPGMKLFGAIIDTAFKLLPIQEGDLNGASIAMGGLYNYYDSSKAETQLGYVRRDLAQTLVEAWDWLKDLEAKK